MEEKMSEIPTNVVAKKTTQEKPRKLTKREFLKAAVGGAVGAALFIKSLEKTFYEGLIAGLTNPDINDKTTTAALKISEAAPDSENPKFRPIAEIIEESVDRYKSKRRASIIYIRSKDYRDASYYAETIDKLASSRIIPRKPSEILEELKKAIPHEAYQAYLEGEYIGNMGFKDYFPLGSGFYERFKEKHSEIIRDDGYIESYDKLFEEMERDGRTEMNEMRKFVEEKRISNDGQPISCSVILERFLEKNKGNLSNSIFDTALFLKFMARNDPNTGQFKPEEFNVEWFKENTLDEYQGPSYTEEQQSANTLNLIGKPYHSWNLVALLKFFPNEIVRAGGLYRQLGSIGEQGVGKTRSDLQTLEDLRRTEQLLLSYS